MVYTTVKNKSEPLRPKAVLIDVDGTLCDVSSARHHVLGVDKDGNKVEKDFDAFHRDSIHCPPNQIALDFAEEYYERGYKLVVVTARMQQWHSVTNLWLEQYMTRPFDGPFMRPQDDFRPDVQIKREIFNYLSRVYDIRAAIDDNPKIIELWKSLGLKTVIVPGWDSSHMQAYLDLQK